MKHPFSLTNPQRMALGLQPIKAEWIEVNIKDLMYLYFEGDVIKKMLYYEKDSDQHFKEWDTEIPTLRKELILPKTQKGKEKKLNPTTVLNYGDAGNYFCFDVFKYREIEEVQIKWKFNGQMMGLRHNSPDYSNIKHLADLNSWLEQFIKSFPPEHAQKMDLIKSKLPAKKKIVKYKEGDFFAVPYRYNLYGESVQYIYGRILLNMYEVNKKKIFPETHLYTSLMTHPLLVRMYAFISEELVPDLESLKKKDKLPSFFMMDDFILRGQYPVIGNQPILAEELSFPMFYGRGFDTKIRFTWGALSIEIPALKDVSEDSFNHCGVSSGVSPFLLEEYLAGRPPYYPKVDIHHPDNAKAKKALFQALGVQEDIEYDAFCQQRNELDREAFLKHWRGGR